MTSYGTEGALGNIADGVGLQVFSSNITVSGTVPTEAEMQTYFGTTEVFHTGHADDGVYVVADDGVDTYVMHLASGGANKVFTAAEDVGTVVAKLNSISDATTLSADNFLDFS